MRAATLIIGFAAFAIPFTGCSETNKYPPGKDTVESFGDGTWSIVRTGGGPKDPRKIHLHCSETHESLVRDIADWRQDGDWVFAVSEDGVYVILNFRTNFHTRYKNLEEFPTEYHVGLRSLRSK